MNMDNFLKNPAIKNMEPRKRQVLIDLANDTNGKSVNQMLPLLVNANNKLRSQGLAFTPEESSLLIDIFTADMNSAERAKLDAMRKMMNMK